MNGGDNGAILSSADQTKTRANPVGVSSGWSQGRREINKQSARRRRRTDGRPLPRPGGSRAI